MWAFFILSAILSHMIMMTAQQLNMTATSLSVLSAHLSKLRLRQSTTSYFPNMQLRFLQMNLLIGFLELSANRNTYYSFAWSALYRNSLCRYINV